ncbi:MAG: DUF3800 domain-containing protein [bacterium]
MSREVRVYIDESGDDGWRIDRGADPWFVVSAVLTMAPEPGRGDAITETIKAVKAEIGAHSRPPLHFRRLKHAQRLIYLRHLAEAPIRIVNVAHHKPDILATGTPRPKSAYERNPLYWDVVLDAIWCACYAAQDVPGLGTSTPPVLKLIFSKRKDLDYGEIREHLRRAPELQARWEAASGQPHPAGIDWNSISPDSVEVRSGSTSAGVQAADAAASSFYNALRNDRHHTLEYLKRLRPVTQPGVSDWFPGNGTIIWANWRGPLKTRIEAIKKTLQGGSTGPGS